MSEIVEGLGGSERERIAALREQGRFFWVDLCIANLPRDELGETLGIPPHAMKPLLDFGRGGRPSSRFHADGQHVVFPFHSYLPGGQDEAGDACLRAIEVNVLVHGDYLLTAHRERLSLPTLLPGYSTEGRSEQYVVYAVLDAMVASAFDALNENELALEEMQVVGAANGNGTPMRMGALRAISLRLATMRRQLGPQRGTFERISEEIGQVEGLEPDHERYFERVYEQLNRVVDGIDAASDSFAKLLDLRLNETIYWLTVIATIFLPLTFLTGFFGMNFAWMVGRIDTLGAFLVLGLGGPALATLLTWLAVKRRGTPVQPDQDAVERLVMTLRGRRH